MNIPKLLSCLLVATLFIFNMGQAQQKALLKIDTFELTEHDMQTALLGFQLLKNKDKKMSPVMQKLLRLTLMKLFKKVPQKINGALNTLKVIVPLVKVIETKVKKGEYTQAEYLQKKQENQALLMEVIDSLLNTKTPTSSLSEGVVSIREVFKKVQG